MYIIKSKKRSSKQNHARTKKRKFTGNFRMRKQQPLTDQEPLTDRLPQTNPCSANSRRLNPI
jgi:hypothetical protein